MLILAILMIGAALVALAAGLGMIALPSAAIRSRLDTLTAQPEAPQRVLFASGESRMSLLSRLTPMGMLRRIERNMVLAGRPDGWTRDRVIIAKPIGAVFGLLFAGVIVSNSSSPLMVLVAIAAVVLGYFVPDLLIYNQAIKRQELIQKVLPDTLDQIVISIEAGVGFESALTRAGENGEGPLADELVRLVQDLALGLSRREAYLALADRTSVAELSNFAKSIVQAEEYGVSVSAVVRSQAKEMRIARRSRAEARAQQVPVKILFPLMVCILPVLFVVVLGPAIVSAYAQT